MGFECNKFFISIRPISPVELHTLPSGLACKYLYVGWITRPQGLTHTFSKPSVQQLRWKNKISIQKTSTTRKTRPAYGPEAVKVTDDISTDDINKLEEEFMEKHINLSAQKCDNITKNTIQQSQSGLWHSERKKRITASNFGFIVRRNPPLPIEFFFRNMLPLWSYICP
jgi:hypothetical protein